MNVKSDRKPVDRIRDILIEQNGMLLTSDLAKLGIPRTYLSILEKKGEIQMESRGEYSAANAISDEMAGLQSRYKTAIFSHETALYLWDLTDRTPLFYSVTVPTGYNANLLKAGRAKIYFVKHELFSLGVTKLKSPYGNDIKAYSLERTICDVIRSRNQMEIQFINEALKLIPSAFEDKRIEVWAYPIETILEEKVETILSRSVLNTRPRDFYDVYILVKTQSQVINSDIFQTALETTARKRMSLEALQNSESTIHPG